MSNAHRPRASVSLSAFACFVFLAAAPATAQEEASSVALIEPHDAEWSEIVPGIDFGTLFGDWQAEAHGKLVRLQPGVISPMHSHSRGYHAVVIAGIVVDPYEGEEGSPRMELGTYWSTPAGAVHATGCVSEDPCLIYAHMNHLWDFEPADDD